MNSKKMGIFIKKLRKEFNYTQNYLANLLFVTRETISKWERGINIPDQDSLLLLSEIFSVSINEILYGEKINEENKDYVNSIGFKILKYSYKKINRIKIVSLSIIIFFLIFFFISYFIINYNSIKIYRIYNNESDYIIKGYIFSSREKQYLVVNDLSINNDDISFVKIYYQNKLLYYGNQSILIDEIGGNVDLDEYHDLYIIIETKNKCFKSLLKKELIYSNKYFATKDIEIISNYSDIDYFNFDNFYYSINSVNYLFEIDNSLNIISGYSNDSIIIYYLENNKISFVGKEDFIYGFNEGCMEGECNYSIINDVIKLINEKGL